MPRDSRDEVESLRGSRSHVGELPFEICKAVSGLLPPLLKAQMTCTLLKLL